MKHKQLESYVRQSRIWLLTVGVGSLLLGILGLGSFFPNGSPLSREWEFTNTNDAGTQQRELLDYVAASQQPRRVVQVDLTQHPKISQFTDINSSASGYGKNACALVAAAAALGGKDWTPLVGRIAEAAGKDYGRRTGIQPSKYAAALQAVFGTDKAKAQSNATLGDVYRELEASQVVIVDMKVNANSRTPSVRRPNYAHFARVLGMDLDRQEIYLENTLAGDPYWTLSLEDFVAVWLRPETTVSDILAPREAEDVTRWFVSIQPTSS